MKIEEVREVVKGFLRTALGKEGTVMKMTRTSDGWEAQVEVVEVSEYIKALGIPTVVRDRNCYELKLDQNLEVVSYERIGQQVVARRTA